MRIFLALTLVLGSIVPAVAQSVMATSAGPVRIEPMVSGLTEPWGMGFLPGGEVLVTERGGTLYLVRTDNSASAVSGVPQVRASGQGGLLDVLVPRDFAETREILLSAAVRQGLRAGGTAIFAGRLSEDGTRLSDVRQLFEMTGGTTNNRHFGGRLIEAPSGHIFLTIGDRGERPAAQDLRRHNGSVIRINRDGSIPADNPFTGTANALPEIWSYGHRNPQGAALDLSGNLWVNEHGAQGGDEVNRISAGANYGWPVISYGRHYSGAKIGEGTAKAGMEQPQHYWDPSIAPSGMTIYSGALWPAWRGDVFVGSLKFGYIARLSPDEDWSEERLESAETGRVRDVREAPDGSIWFLSVVDGAIYRMTPG